MANRSKHSLLQLRRHYSLDITCAAIKSFGGIWKNYLAPAGFLFIFRKMRGLDKGSLVRFRLQP